VVFVRHCSFAAKLFLQRFGRFIKKLGVSRNALAAAPTTVAPLALPAKAGIHSQVEPGFSISNTPHRQRRMRPLASRRLLSFIVSRLFVTRGFAPCFC